MCGIVAYSGNADQTLNVLLSGLKRLEYRGYDSAGIAMFSGKNVYCKKSVGKVSNLELAINDDMPSNTGSVGVAHTRWATHGLSTVANAHPQQSYDKKISLVHNGIIENYREIKNKLEASGIKFQSETDTEVIANLIRSLYKGDLRQAILESSVILEGAFALAVICEDEPNRLIGVKVSSPLVVGLTENEVILASDVSAIIDRTKEVIYLEDGELIDITGADYEIFNLTNEVKHKDIVHIDWDIDTANKGGFEHYLLKEIMEQPDVIKESVRGRLVEAEADIKFGGLIDVRDKLQKINRVVILGIGTSYYSAKLGELYFNALSGIPTTAVMSPEFRYTKNIIDENTWVIAISQSGETSDTIAAVNEAKKHGALITGVVNVVGSTVSRITDAGVYNHIGPEISVASTKAFTSQSVILLMHALLLGRTGDLGFSESLEIINAIKKLPDVINEVLKERNKIEKVASSIKDSQSLLYIGRQYNYPIALEGSLKIKEIAYVHAEGLSGGELKHGFIALIDEYLPTIAIATEDSVTSKMLSNIAEIQARKGQVIAITNKEIPSIDKTIIVPDIGCDFVQPLVNNVVLQLLAYYVAKYKNLDIDQPRNLAKSVTVE